MHTCFCDGGLANRLNGLLFGIILRNKFRHDWEVSWSPNNWCEARFGTLFSLDLPVNERPLGYFVEHQADYRFLVHENQGGFAAERLVLNSTLTGYDAYLPYLEMQQVCYMNSLIPSWVPFSDVAEALGSLKVQPAIVERVDRFCAENAIDGNVFGLHIRKTDFGDRVDDNELYNLVRNHSSRFFVCTDSAEVSDRFAGLSNCCVFEKSHFPQKFSDDGGWNQWITDAEGRSFPFNIRRSEEAIVEGLVDLLILSCCNPVRASYSTFFQMALMFREANFLAQQQR